MPLGPANLIHRPVGDRKVDFVGCGAGLLRSQAEIPEQSLGHTVVTLVLLKGTIPTVRKSTLPAESRDEPQLLERSEMSERGGGTDMERRRDLLEARAAERVLTNRDLAKRLDLTMGQLL